MKTQAIFTAGANRNESLAAAGEPGLAPILAGARARGVADALELLELAAILLDDRGQALHVSRRARALLGADLRLRDGRLEAVNERAQRALAAALHSALEGAPSAGGSLAIPRQVGRSALSLRILPLDASGGDRFQLLKAVIILEEGCGSATRIGELRRPGLN